MGTYQHHAIIVSSWQEYLTDAETEAERLFGTNGYVSIVSRINGVKTLLVPPDGSREGWSESDVGDQRRETFISWLRERGYDYVEVSYGEYGPSIVSHSE